LEKNARTIKCPKEAEKNRINQTYTAESAGVYDLSFENYKENFTLSTLFQDISL
jgi:hypothetical protein